VLDELDRLGLAESTIVVLWGDHGWKLGEYGAWCKHTNFELDTHAPLILRLPGATANGRACNALVEFVDIYPSLCALAGLPLPEHLEGTSLAPLLDNPDRPWKTAAFSQYPRGKIMGHSMRTDRYRLTRWAPQDDPDSVVAVELYDHDSDPGETRNLAVDAAHAEIVKQLQSQLRAGWQAARPSKTQR
jgi:arylsulfatase A-like enzyme